MSNNDIAIIGLAGIFPDAIDVGKYWENISDKKESIREFSDEYLISQGVNEKYLKDPNYVKAGTMLEGAKEFDAEFFGYTPREAEIMDPQQRKFLEVAWGAFENAGYSTESNTNNRIGVFGGSTMNTYILQNLIKERDLLNFLGEQQVMIGNDKDYLTSRVSYKLNFNGPSIVVQTACSSSLYAIHLACQHLLIGDCDMALAGGSSIRMPLEKGYKYTPGGTSSKNGHCYAFDKRANGSVVGSGTGVVVLKRLEDAIKDNDTIHAVIKGSNVGNDGSDKPGFSAPSIQGQARVINDAFTLTGISPESIQYVEAHGTATQLGDPIEFSALTNGFNKSSNKKNYCSLGSVKTNIGHLDAAAGVAGLIKIVMALKNKKIPANSNFESPNDKINLEESPFYINKEILDWEIENDQPRRAAINSIGMGGNDAFMILEEAPAQPVESLTKDNNLLILSSKNEEALIRYKKNLLQFLIDKPDTPLTDLTYTLQVGRNQFDKRFTCVFSDYNDLIQQLSTNKIEKQSTNKNSELTFIFGGNGSQYIDMAKKLYQNNSNFKNILDNNNNKINETTELDLLNDVIKFEDTSLKAKQKINDNKNSELCLFLLEFSLAEFLMNLNILPKSVLGFGIGEYVAGTVSGRIEFKKAVELIKLRSNFIEQDSNKIVLKVNSTLELISEYIDDSVKILSSYSDSLHIVKGDINSINGIERELSKVNIKCEKLFNYSTLNDLEINNYISANQKALCEKDEAIPLIKEIRSSHSTNEIQTNYNSALSSLKEDINEEDFIVIIGHDELIETALNQYNFKNVLSILNGNAKLDYSTFLTTLGSLWSNNIDINWKEFWKKQQVMRIPAPTYPFSKTVYWIDEKVDVKTKNVEIPLPSSGEVKNKKEKQDKLTVNIYEEKQNHEVPSNENKYYDRGQIKEELLSIWKKATGFEEINVKDDLFDLGGHSLMATQIVSSIREKFSVSISIDDMLEDASVEYISDLVYQQLNSLEDKLEDDPEEKMKSEVLEKINSLSDDEVNKILQELR
ncbi:phosphopantetheine-binding protein [Rummeliibacillus stabekisii]|uniref:type I polyketide synthase n=1 Tax=Rummeliibacillus stabekisii TaxID=241244 RepID=UPI00203A9CA6|nr:type I polyketide synthase [Rummeliibacillus stabekisii]MCM3318029.1 phosphopantetheine-binding protein [Rummeliibacillus stabekisii]